VFLEKEGVWICGATLWNHVSVAQEKEAEETMNDYQTILLENGKRWTAADTRIEHAKHRGILQIWIDYVKENNQKIIILTHHLPSLRWIHPDFAKSKINWCYASDCDALLKAPVIGWLCGHTHRAQSFWLKGDAGEDIYCGINPWGYPFEDMKGTRSKTAVMEWPRANPPTAHTLNDMSEEKNLIFV
jgi:hypothetical protein